MCELQSKVEDAVAWLTLQEEKLQQVQKDTANETYYNKYQVSTRSDTCSLFIFLDKTSKYIFGKSSGVKHRNIKSTLSVRAEF